MARAQVLMACFLLLGSLGQEAMARSLRQASPGACSADQAAVLAAAATPDDYPAGDADELIVFGTVANYSGGEVRAYTKYAAGADGNPDCSMGPAAVGVEIDDVTMENLPGPADVLIQPPAVCTMDPMTPGCFPPFDQLWLSFLPDEVKDLSPFPEMQLNWEPVGHEPPNVYTVPHFDFHFYLVPRDDVMNVTGGPCMGLSPESFLAANQPILEGCFPGGKYANLVAVAPMMGNHYISADAPEVAAMLAGQNGVGMWNQTWIYGGYDSQITFFEPMIKRSFVMAKPDQCWDIPNLPTDFSIPGWKPRSWCMVPTDTGVRVEVRDFEWFGAGCTADGPFAPASYATLNPAAPPLPEECEYPEPDMA